MAEGSLYVVGDDQELNAEWFNRLLGDIHTRIRTIEAIKGELDVAISDLTAVGLQRIDLALAPLIQQAQDRVAAVEANLAEVSQQISDLLAGGVPAANVAESATRVFVTPTQREAIGQISGIVDSLATKAAAANATLSGLLTITESLRLSGALTPATITADVNDYAPADLGKNSRLRVSSNAEHAIAGLLAGEDGRILIVENIGASDITLKAESASSIPANRFALGQDFVLSKNGGAATMVYDAGLARWLLAGSGPVPALPIGGVLQAASHPGSRYLPCTGLTYLNASYPTLAPIMKPYFPPLAARFTIVSGVYALAYGAGLFAVFAADASYKTSPDGIAWTARTNPFGANIPESLYFGNGLFVAGPVSSGDYYTSPDGFVWTARTRPSSASYIKAGAYANGRHVIVGTSSSGQAIACYSADLVAWTYSGGVAGTPLTGVCYAAAHGRWGAVGGSYFWYSGDNADNWSGVGLPGPSSTSATGIAFGAGRFVVTHGTGMLTSPTGSTWSAVTDANVAGFDFSSVIFDGARFVAVGAGGRVVMSDDGLAWTARPSGQTVTLNKVVRKDAAITTPLVVGGANGLLSGLEQSTTQFLTPVVAAGASNLANYIRAL